MSYVKFGKKRGGAVIIFMMNETNTVFYFRHEIYFCEFFIEQKSAHSSSTEAAWGGSRQGFGRTPFDSKFHFQKF